MVIVFFGLGVCMVIIAMNFPEGVGMTDGFHLAGALDKLETFDTSLDLTEKYTVWSGLIAALFLFLAYFGTDQVQVQRYLTARSVGEGRTSILMSAFLKIPMQFGILIIGIMVFVFYQFQAPPMIFNEVEAKKAATKAPADYGKVQEKYLAAHGIREKAAVNYVAAKKSGDEKSLASAKVAYVSAHKEFNSTRKEATELVKKVNNNKSFRDVNYVFPTFVISNMPPLVIGLIIAAIFAASMSTISSELNALATATTIDFYRRNFNPDATDREYIRVGRIATFVWGLFACVVALYSTNLGSLIEVVNKFGSFFYGSLLGVFVLAFGIRRARARGAFFGLLFGILFVFITSTLKTSTAGYFLELPFVDSTLSWTKVCVQGVGTIQCSADAKPAIEFLWLNLVGCTATVIFGYLISLTVNEDKK
jgi:Na+/proline symporter